MKPRRRLCLEVQVTDRNSDDNEDKNGDGEMEIETERLSSLVMEEEIAWES